jgi:hypothetical protein
MALKGDRHELDTDISFFMDVEAEKGELVHLSTGGSGAAMDNSSALAVTATGDGDQPLGILLNDVVDIDQTRQHLNWHKDEVQKGGKVTILTKGWVVTDKVTGTPAAGAVAYVNADGTVGAISGGSSAVGRFLGSVDSDGYIKVSINLP